MKGHGDCKTSDCFSYLFGLEERVGLQRGRPVPVPHHLLRVDVAQEQFRPELPPAPPPSPTTFVGASAVTRGPLKRPRLQPQELQFVEREMEDVKTVEVAHGRHRRKAVGGVLDEWRPVPFPDDVVAIATDDAFSSFVRRRRTAKALNGAGESNSAKSHNNGGLLGRHHLQEIWIFAEQKKQAPFIPKLCPLASEDCVEA